jgi:hypothetical protein
MSKEPKSLIPAVSREVRFNLAQLLREAAEERQSGAFGTEKVHQQDIRKIFRAKPRKPRASQG